MYGRFLSKMSKTSEHVHPKEFSKTITFDHDGQNFRTYAHSEEFPEPTIFDTCFKSSGKRKLYLLELVLVL